jgi:hypothetical protein
MSGGRGKGGGGSTGDDHRQSKNPDGEFHDQLPLGRFGLTWGLLLKSPTNINGSSAPKRIFFSVFANFILGTVTDVTADRSNRSSVTDVGQVYNLCFGPLTC